VVITIDAFPFGERRVIMDEDLKYGWERSRYSLEDVRYLNGKCRQKESTVVKSLAYTGMTWPGIVAWDDMRTVDYLVTRPEVDPKRIGCVGVSLEGTGHCCYRDWMIGLQPMRRRIPFHRSSDDPASHGYSLVCPLYPGCAQVSRPSGCGGPAGAQAAHGPAVRRDGLFPLAGMEEGVRKIAAIYRMAGASSTFVGRFYDVPHRFDQAMQEEAFAWFDSQLSNS